MTFVSIPTTESAPPKSYGDAQESSVLPLQKLKLPLLAKELGLRRLFREALVEYIAKTEERWLKDKYEGNLLLLDDDSLWEINPQADDRAQQWLRFSSVKVTPPDPNARKPIEYGYILVNESYKDAVRAKYLGMADSRDLSLAPAI